MLTKTDKGSWLVTVWAALEDYADYVADNKGSEEQWEEICTAMAFITDELGLEYNEDGDYVDVG